MSILVPVPRSWWADAVSFAHGGVHRKWAWTAAASLWTGTWLPGLVRFATAPSDATSWRPADYIALLGVILSFVGLIAAPFINVYINRRWANDRKRPARRTRRGE